LLLRTLAPFTPFRSSTEISGIVSRVFDRGAIKDLPTGSHIPALACHADASRRRRARVGRNDLASQIARNDRYLRQSRHPDAAEGRSALAGGSVVLNSDISCYVALHRGLGRKFSEQCRMLQLFADYAERFGDQHTKIDRIYG